MAAYAKRTGRAATSYFAIGDAQVIRDRVAAYAAVGIEKFILRPVGSGDEVIAQTKRLIEHVLPHI
jgi:alkanesulfonate monooxygenase SsuD/methylene tetrahydromethanopterin reductase-like flavin-dependent oxidoreductase (luciferase family)